MIDGTIYKALSGFYYVETEKGQLCCKARGKFRRDKITPLVGDRVAVTETDSKNGIVEEILPRKNYFIRPPVANIDQIIIVASAAIPVTVPFLIDRIAAIAEINSCEPVICINKIDIKSGRELYDIYSKVGFKTVEVSAATGEGIDELRNIMSGKINALTGNSGVGKSSILNAIDDRFGIDVGEVSEKLGRGRHTTRHVELYKIGADAIVADTPGFSSFDTGCMELTDAEKLSHAFREFTEYAPSCRFNDCTHTKEDGCAVLEAVRDGKIPLSRHESYLRLYEQVKEYKPWENKSN